MIADNRKAVSKHIYDLHVRYKTMKLTCNEFVEGSPAHYMYINVRDKLPNHDHIRIGIKNFIQNIKE